MAGLLLKNAQLLRRGQLVPQDVLIEDGTIKAIAAPGTFAKYEGGTRDLTGLFLSAGFVDVHQHFRDPGQTDKETIATGTKAAAHGGFTTVAAMPNITPTPDTPDLFEAQMAHNANQSVIHIKQYAPITMRRVSDDLVDFEKLAALGAFAFTNDGNGVQTADTMYQAMKRARELNLAIVAHAEDDSLVHGGVMHEGAASRRLNLPGIPSVSETVQVARDVVLAAETGVHYHVCHVSSRHTVAVLRAAKAAGVHVTAEVSPHHLVLSDEDIVADDAMFKMNPPLGAPKDQEALLAGLLDGTLDMIATDHAPHTLAEKSGSMTTAPFGIIGNETAFSVMYTQLVKTGKMTLAQLVDWMTAKPADVFGMQGAGHLEVGQPADLVALDLDHEAPINVDQLFSKGQNSPFIGLDVAGHTALTLVDGQVVFER